jgi:hypothetical protein
MNANELADELDWVCENHLVGIGDADFKAIATMLRQQEKELTEAGHMIGVLREYISDLEKGLDSSINLNKAQAEKQKSTKYSDEWWKEVEEFNKQLRAQKK